MGVRRAAVWTCLVLALPLAGCAGPMDSSLRTGPTGQIDGALLDGFLHPIGRTPVFLVELGLHDDTSDLGGFTFRGLAPGNYTVTAGAAGMRGMTRTVEVAPGHVTRVILQLVAIPPPAGEIRSQSMQQTFHFPAPGTQADLDHVRLDSMPDDLDMVVSWSSSVPGAPPVLSGPCLQLQLWDNAGELLGKVEDQSGWAIVHASLSAMSNGTTAVTPRVVFCRAPDGTPTPPQAEVRVDATVRLYYGTTHDQLLGLQ